MSVDHAPPPPPMPDTPMGEPMTFATNLSDAQIEERCKDRANPDYFALWMTLVTAGYARQLADHPGLAAHESSWLMGARDAIYWLAERLLAERAEVTRLRSPATRGERLRKQFSPLVCEIVEALRLEEINARAVLCRVFDDVDEVYAEWDAFDKSGWFSNDRALGAFIRGRLDRAARPTPDDGGAT